MRLFISGRETPLATVTSMSAEIRPTHLDELAELSQFLTQGFHAPAEAAFAAPDVLRWKYFDPRGGLDVPRSYIAVEDRQIVGHLGLATGAFMGDAVVAGEVPTLHMVDWLSGRRGSSVGAQLMLRTHRNFPTGFGLGGSDAGRSVGGGGGYHLLGTVPVFRRTLRLGRLLRTAGIFRWGKELVRNALNRRQRAHTSIELRQVEQFGGDIAPILAQYRTRAVFTNRRPELLNHMLRYPRGGISGWILASDGRPCGFALLSIVTQGELRLGKLVDCVLDRTNPLLWHASVDTLTGELARQGADIAEAFASTPWMATALRQSGYYSAHRLEFRLRDKHQHITPGAVFHLTPLEADYAFTA